MHKSSSTPILLAIVLIVLAAITRFLQHPFNFTAIGAMALFSGANIRDKRYAFLLPVVAMLLTDLYFGFHISMLPVYCSFAFTVLAGRWIRNKQSVLTVG